MCCCYCVINSSMSAAATVTAAAMYSSSSTTTMMCLAHTITSTEESLSDQQESTQQLQEQQHVLLTELPAPRPQQLLAQRKFSDTSVPPRTLVAACSSSVIYNRSNSTNSCVLKDTSNTSGRQRKMLIKAR